MGRLRARASFSLALRVPSPLGEGEGRIEQADSEFRPIVTEKWYNPNKKQKGPYGSIRDTDSFY